MQSETQKENESALVYLFILGLMKEEAVPNLWLGYSKEGAVLGEGNRIYQTNFKFWAAEHAKVFDSMKASMQSIDINSPSLYVVSTQAVSMLKSQDNSWSFLPQGDRI